MNGKNFILTMLACLNCVHTTHAVESTPKATQEVDSETMDKLRILWALHERRCRDFPTISVIHKGDITQVTWVLHKGRHGNFRDIAITNDIAIAKDALLEGLRDIINCLHSLPETVLTKNHCRGVTDMLTTKTKELCQAGSIFYPMQGYKYNDNNKIEFFYASRSYYPPSPYTDLLRTGYPDLAQYFDVTYHKLLPPRLNLRHLLRLSDTWVTQATKFDARIDGLGTKYPNIAKQIVDWEKMMWKSDIIEDIKNNTIGKLTKRIHLGEVMALLGASNSKITQEVWNTILNTIHHCLIGEDQDLAEKTERVLEHNPVLRQEIESRIGRMTLAKIVKPKGKISDHLQECVFLDVVKYL
jgi:hypothetical protein